MMRMPGGPCLRRASSRIRYRHADGRMPCVMKAWPPIERIAESRISRSARSHSCHQHNEDAIMPKYLTCRHHFHGRRFRFLEASARAEFYRVEAGAGIISPASAEAGINLPCRIFQHTRIYGKYRHENSLEPQPDGIGTEPTILRAMPIVEGR